MEAGGGEGEERREDEIVKALNDTEFDTVVGKFKFNEKGDPNLPPYAVYRWSKGTYEQIDPPAAPAEGKRRHAGARGFSQRGKALIGRGMDARIKSGHDRFIWARP